MGCKTADSRVHGSGRMEDQRREDISLKVLRIYDAEREAEEGHFSQVVERPKALAFDLRS